MKLATPFVLALGALVLAQSACASDQSSNDPSSSESEALVEDVDSDGSGDADDPDNVYDDLGPDPEPMLSEAEIDTAASRPDDVQDAEAAQELAVAMAAADPPVIPAAATAAAPKIRCKKRLHVTFAVYTYLTQELGSNGCWTSEDTVSDKTFRDCHSNGDITHDNGNKWFYDDTNPRNDLGLEEKRVAKCASGTQRGYEYMAFRDGSWRLVTHKHTSAYFAELYTDDAHIDDLWYQSSVYRNNHALKKHRRAYPMLNFAPFPDGRYSQGDIGKEILKVCKTVRNHGYLGLYEWHYPMPAGSPRLAGMVHALNACTKR
jgi:hypothetical protein